jgi:hypothetical protein
MKAANRIVPPAVITAKELPFMQAIFSGFLQFDEGNWQLWNEINTTVKLAA